jgi:hypothetical protein
MRRLPETAAHETVPSRKLEKPFERKPDTFEYHFVEGPP